MCKKVIVIGGGGHAKIMIDCIRRAGDTVFGVLDDGLATGTEILGAAVLGKVDSAPDYPDCQFVIAIGNNAVRKAISEKLDVHWYTAIHPRAVVSEYATVGEGTMVLANAVVNPCATVGRHCIINTASVVEHDNKIADFVHISPRAALAGNVTVGELTQVGIGAAVRQNITICGGCVIGAGAAVVKDISKEGIYAGVPAKKLCK